ncbi:hypothetical protein BDW68DRAFT_125950 [Aspergillus falconensis]
MRMSRATTLLNLVLGLRTATSAPTTFSTSLIRSQSPASYLFAQCHATNLYSHYSATRPSTYSYTTMSTNSDTNANNNPEQHQDQTLEKKPILALPAASSNNDTTQLDVNGEGVKLDHLGPLVVNSDGTLSRIANWAQMTEIERRNTLRVLGKRNKERRDKLKEAQAQAQGQDQGQVGEAAKVE